MIEALYGVGVSRSQFLGAEVQMCRGAGKKENDEVEIWI